MGVVFDWCGKLILTQSTKRGKETTIATTIRCKSIIDGEGCKYKGRCVVARDGISMAPASRGTGAHPTKEEKVGDEEEHPG